MGRVLKSTYYLCFGVNRLFRSGVGLYLVELAVNSSLVGELDSRSSQWLYKGWSSVLKEIALCLILNIEIFPP